MTILFVVQIIVVVMMIGLILMQKTSSDGLMSGSSPDSFLTGRASANILSRATAILATIFIINSLVMGYLVSHTKRTESVVDEVFAGKAEDLNKSEKLGAEKLGAEKLDSEKTDATKNNSAPVENTSDKTTAVPAIATDKTPAKIKPASVPAAD
jgi:preprotein translocase subunit SecG